MKENMEAIYEKAVDVAQSAKRTAVLLATISQKSCSSHASRRKSAGIIPASARCITRTM